MTTERLAGKRALVTAGGQGIGRAAVLALAEAGAEVIATDINEGALAEFDHPKVSTRTLDVMDPEAVKTVVAEVRPNVLFNCAGYVHAGTVLEATEEDWDFAFGLNARAMFRTIRAALPGMLEDGGGSIVNMASLASSLKGVPNRCVYGASKAAVIGLTKAVAADYVTKGVRCNAICPGTVESPSLHERLRATGDYEQAMKDFVARQPMGRLAQPEEIAALVVYLASDESAFVSGQAYAIDGGWSI